MQMHRNQYYRPKNIYGAFKVTEGLFTDDWRKVAPDWFIERVDHPNLRMRATINRKQKYCAWYNADSYHMAQLGSMVICDFHGGITYVTCDFFNAIYTPISKIEESYLTRITDLSDNSFRLIQFLDTETAIDKYARVYWGSCKPVIVDIIEDATHVAHPEYQDPTQPYNIIYFKIGFFDDKEKEEDS